MAKNVGETPRTLLSDDLDDRFISRAEIMVAEAFLRNEIDRILRNPRARRTSTRAGETPTETLLENLPKKKRRRTSK